VGKFNYLNAALDENRDKVLAEMAEAIDKAMTGSVKSVLNGVKGLPEPKQSHTGTLKYTRSTREQLRKQALDQLFAFTVAFDDNLTTAAESDPKLPRNHVGPRAQEPTYPLESERVIELEG
jgi:hypothetical protein